MRGVESSNHGLRTHLPLRKSARTVGDIYPQAHRAKTATPTQPGPLAGGRALTPIAAKRPGRGGRRPRSCPPSSRRPSSSVNLQTPLPIEAKPSSRLSSASVGVPNGSRILASSEPRSQTKPTNNSAQLVAEARTALNALTTYQVALHRQERVNDSLLPEEDVVLAVRREPRAVRLTWPGGDNQGREVLYRSDEPGGQMHIKMADSALHLKLSMSPDSPMVMKNSRHPVTEAGFDSLVRGLEEPQKTPGSFGDLLHRPGIAGPASIIPIRAWSGRGPRVRYGGSISTPRPTSPRLVDSGRWAKRGICSSATSSETSAPTFPSWPPQTPSTPTPGGARRVASSAVSLEATSRHPSLRRANCQSGENHSRPDAIVVSGT